MGVLVRVLNNGAAVATSLVWAVIFALAVGDKSPPQDVHMSPFPPAAAPFTATVPTVIATNTSDSYRCDLLSP
ncbi:hypothetical protein LWI28_002278 [Acer negundo]|uniref:Uncharacterized protein n=1 Tax=Acer negundo TaxID=4023 RepID=A0AAD5NPL7_ACENE|nr:hypothetical protein LWI28_002278 [Acer negundo]